VLESPAATVLAFASEFSEWERRMAKSDDPFNDRELRAEHARILADYCTLKKRVYVDCAPSFSKPPTYADLDESSIEGVEMATKSRSHVDTKALRGLRYRFVVLKKSDGWRIDSLKRWSDFKERWENTLIGL
jgi:hypothetical protein